MCTMKKIASILILVCVVCTLFSTETEAASTKTVYVVSGITVSNDQITNASGIITYDKNGFIKSTDITTGYASYRESFSYDSKGQMKTFVRDCKYDNGGSMGMTCKYTWKNGKVKKLTTDWTDNTSDIVKYTYKNNHVTSGSYNDGKITWSFSYHNGRLSSVGQYNNSMCVYLRELKYDSEGNVSKWAEKSWGKTVWTEKRRLSYDNKNRVKKITFINPYGTPVSKQTYKFTYKKISVKSTNVKAIEEQQWKLINNLGNGAVLNLFYI